jgi:hypothetical protein
VISQLHALAGSPNEIEVEFAIKLTADARIAIARAGGEANANLRIALKWSGTPDSPPPGSDKGP